MFAACTREEQQGASRVENARVAVRWKGCSVQSAASLPYIGLSLTRRGLFVPEEARIVPQITCLVVLEQCCGRAVCRIRVGQLGERAGKGGVSMGCIMCST